VIDWPALETRNAALNAFVDWDRDAAAATGPLAGLTLGVKANIMTRGLPWTGGMALYRDRIASRDAAVVARLRAAGATILGSLNMHEAALGATTDNAFYGRTHNPHAAGFTAGGSSGGSGAAVAAGLCDAALGTDTLGSVRIPAAYCGVYGLKPTHGVVSQDGLAMLEPEFDVIGPLARDLDVLERVWNTMVQPTPPSPTVRILALAGLAQIDCDASVLSACDRALAALPAATDIALADSLTDIRMAGLVAAGHWLIAALGTARVTHADQISDPLHGILTLCEKLPPQPARVARTKATLIDAIGSDGFLIMPTAPQTAFAHGTRAPANQADFTCLASIAGLPALAIPAGVADNGLPVSIQIVGPAHSEARLIALARSLKPALGGSIPPPQET
jgi:aspartyl-tRNA(Asn)/glutamyl-tRNA(Gln) amidotransferase subunit A